ncbi:MAG TPA: hypothetical protein VHJ20_03475 [Polyangia bacterium]|nr:hypothetical protein [Polyangia bacterium]
MSARSSESALKLVAAYQDEASTLSTRYAKVARSGAAAASVKSILSALQEFTECVRYLNTRRSTSAVLELNSEAAVQDALYLMLRPWITDLVPESPTSREGNRYSIKDFVTVSSRCIIEAKFVRDKDHARNISRELHDDIEMYRSHPACRDLIFFVYDPDHLVADSGALRRQIEVDRTYNGVPLFCHLVVKP